MIEIRQNDADVIVSIETGLFEKDGSRTRYLMTIQCGNRQFAQLLSDHMKSRLFGRIQQIRRSAYEAGYRAGRSKLAKTECFMGVLNGDQFEEE